MNFGQVFTDIGKQIDKTQEQVEQFGQGVQKMEDTPSGKDTDVQQAEVK